MNRKQDGSAFEPKELGIASVATQGGGWPKSETEGYRFDLLISDE